MTRIKFIAGIAVVALSLQPVFAQQSSGSGGRDANGSGAPPMTGQEPTQFEQFVDKLKLDKTQMPQVQSILTSAAADASPIERDMMRLRQKMLESADKPADLAAATAAYQADAVKMANVEIKSFGEIKAVLKPNQMGKSAEAFMLMAGIFHPPTPRSGGGGRRGGGVSQVRYESSGFAAPAPQRGGGGSRGGGGMMPMGPPTRLVALSSALPIAEADRKHLKETMDLEYKAAAPVRDQLMKTRTALSQAVASGGSTDQGVADYAAAVATMATAEMKALAKIIGTLTGEQRPSGRSLDTAIYLMRGAFAGKKWDMAPDLKFY